MKTLALLAPLLFATPALANSWCDELWFSRNLVMHNAGYCFGSTLGKTYFGTGPCIGKSVSPDRDGQRLVARIQKMEAESSCKGRVNTRGTYLDVRDIGIRMQLNDLPVAADQPAACVGWRGPRLALFAGKRIDDHPLGEIQHGDAISYDHQAEDGWVYVTAHDYDGQSGPWSLKSGGWIPENQIRAADCDYTLP